MTNTDLGGGEDLDAIISSMRKKAAEEVVNPRPLPDHVGANSLFRAAEPQSPVPAAKPAPSFDNFAAAFRAAPDAPAAAPKAAIDEDLSFLLEEAPASNGSRAQFPELPENPLLAPQSQKTAAAAPLPPSALAPQPSPAFSMKPRGFYPPPGYAPGSVVPAEAASTAPPASVKIEPALPPLSEAGPSGALAPQAKSADFGAIVPGLSAPIEAAKPKVEPVAAPAATPGAEATAAATPSPQTPPQAATPAAPAAAKPVAAAAPETKSAPAAQPAAATPAPTATSPAPVAAATSAPAASAPSAAERPAATLVAPVAAAAAPKAAVPAAPAASAVQTAAPQTAPAKAAAATAPAAPAPAAKTAAPATATSTAPDPLGALAAGLAAVNAGSAPQPAQAKAATAAPATPAPGASPAAAATQAQGSRTLEDVVSDMLRPLLQKWVADNMPKMVEKALREELSKSFAGDKKPPGA